MREVGICRECGRSRVIVNKKYSLCGECNHKRLGGVKRGSAPKSSKLQRAPLKRKPAKATGERELFLELWEERPHYCTNCGEYLGEKPLVHFFSHIKSKGSSPGERLNKENIEFLCLMCHHIWEHGDREKFFERRKI